MINNIEACRLCWPYKMLNFITMFLMPFFNNSIFMNLGHYHLEKWHFPLEIMLEPYWELGHSKFVNSFMKGNHWPCGFPRKSALDYHRTSAVFYSLDESLQTYTWPIIRNMEKQLFVKENYSFPLFKEPIPTSHTPLETLWNICLWKHMFSNCNSFLEYFICNSRRTVFVENWFWGFHYAQK